MQEQKLAFKPMKLISSPRRQGESSEIESQDCICRNIYGLHREEEWQAEGTEKVPGRKLRGEEPSLRRFSGQWRPSLAEDEFVETCPLQLIT